MIEPFFVPSTDGVDVAVYDFGGTGPLLVMCHATGFCGGVWEPVAAHLVDRFHCVALDFRGHGRSVRPDGLAMQWQGMGADLTAVIDAVRLRRGDDSGAPVFAAGHSMGGASIVLAELSRPGTITKAWAFEPILFPTPPDAEAAPDGDPIHESPLVAGARRRRAVFESKDAAEARYGSRPPLSSLAPESLRAYVDYGFEERDDGTARLWCDPETEAQVFEHSLCGAFHRLDEIRFPFLAIMSGDGGPPSLIGPSLREANPRIAIDEFAELTHFGPLEDPARIAASIAGWLTSE